MAAPSTSASRSWRYQLLPGSYLFKDCPPCGGPAILESMRGTFDLRLEEENPISSRYAMENISFTAGSVAGRFYTVAGQGTYTIGGEVALLQEMTLEVNIDDGFTNRLSFFASSTPQVERLWPMIEATADQTNGTFTQVYHLHVFAAPYHEIWFSTVSGMTSSLWSPPTNHLSGGDLLSSAGHVVKFNRELTRNFGIMPIVPDLGLDAVDLLAGGELAFSIERDVFSETLGFLQHGDLLSQRGRILESNSSLISAFNPMPAIPDAGLDGVQAQEEGEIYFSVQTNFFSKALGRQVRSGDLLSNRGFVVKSNEQLVARLQPVDPGQDFGLDAFYVWPSSEVWFSVEKGFQTQQFESLGPGDILSDQGYVVARNLELVGPFQPVEDLADFGLDALFIVTDALPPAPAPRFRLLEPQRTTKSVRLEWEGAGRVWQVLQSTNVLGPWSPASPILPDLLFDYAPATNDQSFFLLRQW